MKFAGRFREKFGSRFSQKFGAGRATGGGEAPFSPIPGFGNLNNGLYWDLSKGSLTPDRGPTFTLTRASATTSIDLNDLVVNISSGQPRWRRIGASSGIVGLDVYGAHKNCVVQSEDWATTWTAVGTPTRVAGSQTVGVVSLDTIGDDDATALEGYTQNITFTGDSTKSVLVYIKKGTATSSVIRLRDTTAPADRLLAAITWTGSVPTVTMTTGTLVESQALADGVYRINMTTTAITAASTNSLEFYPATDATLLSVVATGTIIWGGVMATDAVIGTVPYVKTTTAAVSVAADSVTATYAGGTEGGLFVQGITGYGTAVAQMFLAMDDGTLDERVSLPRSATTNTMTTSVVDGGTTQSTIFMAAVANNTAFKLASRYKLNDSNGALDGTAGTADTACTMPTMTTIRVGGRSDAGIEANGTIQIVGHAPVAPSDAGMATATTP